MKIRKPARGTRSEIRNWITFDPLTCKATSGHSAHTSNAQLTYLIEFKKIHIYTLLGIRVACENMRVKGNLNGANPWIARQLYEVGARNRLLWNIFRSKLQKCRSFWRQFELLVVFANSRLEGVSRKALEVTQPIAQKILDCRCEIWPLFENRQNRK